MNIFKLHQRQYSSKIVDKKGYYILFIIPLFIIQVTKLVQLT
jgi:hypothetical protein